MGRGDRKKGGPAAEIETAGRATPPAPAVEREVSGNAGFASPRPPTGVRHRLREIISGEAESSVQLKFVEIVIALFILIGTIFVGITANSILSRQNRIVSEQLKTSDRLGRQQNQAALLQAYISSIQEAGFETEQQRRMLHLSLDLYGLLTRDDRMFRMLYTSMPSISDAQLAELVAARPNDSDAIRQLFARRNDVSRLPARESPYRVEPSGPYHIVIGTFRDLDNAQASLVAAVEFLTPTTFRPNMNIMYNEDNLFLATLSGFETREEAQNAVGQQRIATRFESVYVSLRNGWDSLCTAQFQPCRASRPARAQRRPPPPTGRIIPPDVRAGVVPPDTMGNFAR